MFKWVILLIVLAAGAAWLTKPGVAAFDDMLRARLEHQIATEDVWLRQSHRDGTRANVGINRVDRDGAHLHKHFAWTGRGVGELIDLNPIGSSGLRNEGGTHGEADILYR